MEHEGSRIIILNGVSSVGKSSTALALQKRAKATLLHVAMDAFIDMLPARTMGDADGLTFQEEEIDGVPVISIQRGPVFQRLMRGMTEAIGALADQGNDIVVDIVMLGGEYEAYRRLSARHEVQFVGLFAPLDILETREQARGDRVIGLARGQIDLVHRDVTYDLQIDTVAMSPQQAAEAICAAFGL